MFLTELEYDVDSKAQYSGENLKISELRAFYQGQAAEKNAPGATFALLKPHLYVSILDDQISEGELIKAIAVIASKLKRYFSASHRDFQNLGC